MKKIFTNPLNNLNFNLINICLLIVIIIPLNLANLNQSIYNLDLFISLFIITIFLSLILVITLNFFALIDSKLNIYKIISILVRYLLLWVFITGIFFPVSGDHDPFFNLSLSINKKYEIIIKFILITLFFIFLEKKDKKKIFMRFLYIFVFINFVFLLVNINHEKNEIVKNNLNVFGKKNLIVLSFDGISGHKIYEEILSNKKLNQNLKDFKLYKNTITGFPFTSGSINIEINGKFKEKNDEEFYKNILNEKKLNTSVYSYYGASVLDKKNVINKGEFKEYNNYFKLNKFVQTYGLGSVGRWSTPLGVFLFEPLFYKQYYQNFLKFLSIDNDNKLNPFDTIQTVFYDDLYEYDLIFDNISYDKNLNNVVRMFHFAFSHWPVLINEDCVEVRSLGNDVSSYDHEEIVLKCVSKKIIRFIKNLKVSKLYDNSLIIIKSDHGKPNYIEKNYSTKMSDLFKEKKLNKYYKEYPYNQKINKSFYWGYGRYKTFILIKNQDQQRDNIEISQKQIFLHDLSTTYCNYFFNHSECNYLGRNNLIDGENEFKDYVYDVFLPKNKNSFTKISDFKKYEISNNLPFLDFFKSNQILLSD